MQGPSLTYSTACSSSSVALGEAFHAIARGSIKFAVAGGADAMLTTGTLKAWQALQTLAREDENDPATSCRPFAADRSGFVIGEGAGAIILEDADHAMRRGATIYAEIVGFGVSSDAQHITKPSPQGQARAIASALKVAGLNATDIGYINAHGTATSVGDVSETQALKLALGDAAKHIPISSTKSMHGHVMGASGAIEFIVTLMALKQSVLPPTAHLFTPDPQCDLDYIPLVARGVKGFKAALSNSFAFGGNNAVLAVRSFDR